ncbi:hypothetical protein EVAR_55767_1 [Eumeta japonica]|uniref:EF-hand domain-containing protein n=1 Tax=Eumeta variegata TaxID=151549 RepID=A0A4C1XEM9_EUMVA|nr:hypothetical protein EVAR_55767_1 [Eumeta japonica]
MFLSRVTSPEVVRRPAGGRNKTGAGGVSRPSKRNIKSVWAEFPAACAAHLLPRRDRLRRADCLLISGRQTFVSTWVNRFSEDLGCLDLEEEQPLAQLSNVQSDKLTLFFTEVLDMDRDDVICDQDFDHFFEKLAHFADWSANSSEFHILLEVKREFIEHFLGPLPSKITTMVRNGPGTFLSKVNVLNY